MTFSSMTSPSDAMRSSWSRCVYFSPLASEYIKVEWGWHGSATARGRAALSVQCSFCICILVSSISSSLDSTLTITLMSEYVTSGNVCVQCIVQPMQICKEPNAKSTPPHCLRPVQVPTSKPNMWGQFFSAARLDKRLNSGRNLCRWPSISKLLSFL